jgi:WD40 repeat protein
MTDIFISYSRKDIAYARLLHDALRENDFETWIDWQDIPPSVDWLNEVYTAIEGADTFIFILSGSSSLSEICQKEIEHAAKNNKRLIPIMIDDVNSSSIHPVLAAINWIFSRTKDEFQPAIEQLIEAIQTDYEWIKSHTRLQVRALEWERAGNDKSFLLNGTDLLQAEEWLARSGDKQTQPTALHTQYLIASRRAAIQRQQVTFGAVLLGLIVALALGLVAWNQRNQAVSQSNLRATSQANAETASTQAVAEAWQRGTAEAQAVNESYQRATAESEAINRASIARSRQLASASIIQQDQDQELALLLAIEASQEAETNESAGALRRALVHPGRTLHLLLGHTGSVYSANWDPEGLRILSSGEDGTARVWDAVSGEILLVLEGHTGAVTTAIWDDEGRYIATAGEDGKVRVWDADTGREKVLINAHPSEINVMAWSPDGTKLLTGGEDGFIRIWNVSGGVKSIGLSAFDEPVTHAAWNNDGSLVLAGSSLGAKIINATTSEQQTITLDPGLKGRIAFAGWSNDNSQIALGDLGSIFVFGIPENFLPDKEGDDLISSIKYDHSVPAMIYSGISHVEWDSNNSRILSVSGNGTAEIWDAANGGSKAFLLGHTAGVNGGVWSPDDEMVATASDDGTARIWKSANGLEFAKLTGHRDSVLQVAWDPSGTRLVTASADGSIRIWAVEALDQISSGTAFLQEFSSWSPDGNLLISGPYGYSIWNPDSGEDLVNMDGQIAWSPAGNHLLTVQEDGYIHLWDIDEFLETKGAGTPNVILPGDSGSWSPDGSKVASFTQDGKIRIWDAATGKELVTLNLNPDSRLKLVWSPDSTRIASVEQSTTDGEQQYLVVIWDVATGSQLLAFPVFVGRNDPDVFWNPGSTQLLTFGNAKVAQVWDAETGNQILELAVHNGSVIFAAWSPDGNRIVTTSNDNTARIWDANTGNLITVLSGHVGIVDHADWNPNGTAIATAGLDGTARIWDVQSGNSLAVISGFYDIVRTAYWSPDGSRLVVSSWGGPARVVRVPLVNMLENACNHVVRNMTENEWVKEMGDIPYRETCPDKPIINDYIPED